MSQIQDVVSSYRETSEIQASAFAFATQFESQSTPQVNFPQDAVAAMFEAIMAAHRQRLPIRMVQFLPNLCFPIESSRDANGLRFVLWRPVLEFIQTEFHVHVEEYLCDGEVGLVYLHSDVAAITNLIYPTIEKSRLCNPFRREEAAFRVAFNSLCQVELELKEKAPEASKVVARIHRNWLPPDITSQNANKAAELQELASRVPSWAVDVCVRFLRQAESDEADNTRSLALASERVLASEWLAPAEEIAWRDL